MEGIAVTNRLADPAGQGLEEFGSVGVVVQGLAVFGGVGQDLPVGQNQGDAGAGFFA